jgi:hypothetical protein
METSYASLPDIVIPIGTNVSQVFNGVWAYHDAVRITIYGTGAYGAETYTIEGNQKQDATNADSGWVTLKSDDNTTNMALPPAGEMKSYETELIGTGSFRVKASGNVAAERRWKANKLWSWMGAK